MNLKEQIKKDTVVKVDYLIMGKHVSGSIFADVTKTDSQGFYFKASKKSPSRYIKFSSIDVENDSGVTVKVKIVR